MSVSVLARQHTIWATECSSQSSHPLPPPTLPIKTSPEKVRRGILPIPMSESEILSSPHLKAFTFNELSNAARNFRPSSLLGEGGFGFVYKGWLDKETLTAGRPGSGIVVAVKKLKPHGFQGHKEWLSEVNYLGRLHHPNLVKLIGYCLEEGAQPLSWATRIKVAIGAARGLSFLHDSESQVIYRDFKASNVLLDAEFNAKLSDFGLAKAGPTGDLTHVSTQVMGTQGYAAPEYVATGRLTAKCDVYSFGVVLLELLTGHRAFDETRVSAEQKLVDWVRPQLRDKRKLYRIMDTKLEAQYPRKGAYVAATLALHCVNIDARARPPMADVLAILEKLPSPKFMAIHSPSEQKNEV
ncbi:unnamed protein product [Ilex paraguariensis]|uniref:non-specific serine/threonine protein kinase n=1 Tax=Ilex paraguariensis TaxID=185542 RepID=A0ABC8SI16_9AQUA